MRGHPPRPWLRLSLNYPADKAANKDDLFEYYEGVFL